MSKLTCVASVALVGLLVGLGIHVAGFVTQFWMAADESGSGSGLLKLLLALVQLHIIAVQFANIASGTFATIKTQMKCTIRRHFISVCTVCQIKTIFRDRNASFFIEILPNTP